MDYENKITQLEDEVRKYKVFLQELYKKNYELVKVLQKFEKIENIVSSLNEDVTTIQRQLRQSKRNTR